MRFSFKEIELKIADDMKKLNIKTLKNNSKHFKIIQNSIIFFSVDIFVS